MRIQHKQLIGSALLTITSATVVDLVGAWTAGSESRGAMEEQVRRSLAIKPECFSWVCVSPGVRIALRNLI